MRDFPFSYIYEQQVVLPRRYRTVVPATAAQQDCGEENEGEESLLTKECLKSYTSHWNLVHYKYSAYGGTYLDLPKYDTTKNNTYL